MECEANGEATDVVIHQDLGSICELTFQSLHPGFNALPCRSWAFYIENFIFFATQLVIVDEEFF
jgi:hypothetical protein